MSDVFGEIRRALCRDGSHVVLIVDPPVDVALPSQIARRICDATRVEIAHLAGLGPEAASRHVLAALGVTGPEPEPRIRARIELELLEKLRSSLVLVIPDALRVDPRILRSLGDLARSPAGVLRLALLADRDDGSGRDPTATVVEALGAGAAKIELVERSTRADDPLVSSRLMPPVVPVQRSGRARPIPVRSPPRGRRLASRPRRVAPRLAIVALVLAVAVPTTVVLTQHAPSEPRAGASSPLPAVALREPPVRVAAGPVTLAAPETRAVVSTPVPESRVGRRRPSRSPPAAKPRTPPKPQPAPPPPPPPPPPPKVTVQVSLNASPWAEIEVDGRPVGPTPIGNLALEKGVRRLRATFPDGRVVERDLHVDELQNRFRID